MVGELRHPCPLAEDLEVAVEVVDKELLVLPGTGFPQPLDVLPSLWWDKNVWTTFGRVGLQVRQELHHFGRGGKHVALAVLTRTPGTRNIALPVSSCCRIQCKCRSAALGDLEKLTLEGFVSVFR